MGHSIPIQPLQELGSLVGVSPDTLNFTPVGFMVALQPLSYL